MTLRNEPVEPPADQAVADIEPDRESRSTYPGRTACNGMLEKIIDRPITVAVISLSIGVMMLLILYLASSSLRPVGGSVAVVCPGSASGV